MPTRRKCSRRLPRFRTCTNTCLMAVAGSTHQRTSTSSAPRRWRMVVVPWACSTRYATSAAPQAEGVRPHTSRVRRSCSSSHSAGGSATGSLDHAVSWFRRLLSAQVLPAPVSDTMAPSWALASTLTQGLAGRSAADTSNPKVPVTGAKPPTGAGTWVLPWCVRTSSVAPPRQGPAIETPWAATQAFTWCMSAWPSACRVMRARLTKVPSCAADSSSSRSTRRLVTAGPVCVARSASWCSRSSVSSRCRGMWYECDSLLSTTRSQATPPCAHSRSAWASVRSKPMPWGDPAITSTMGRSPERPSCHNVRRSHTGWAAWASVSTPR